jgi:hypothetical protein
MQGVLKVHGALKWYSGALKGAFAPDDATAGTAEVGANVGGRAGGSVGEEFVGEGVVGFGVVGGRAGRSVGEGVVGFGVGAGVLQRVGVPAQTHAQRWTARHKADVSTRRVPIRCSQFAKSSRAVSCVPVVMCHTTPTDAQRHTHVRTFWEYPHRYPRVHPMSMSTP